METPKILLYVISQIMVILYCLLRTKPTNVSFKWTAVIYNRVCVYCGLVVSSIGSLFTCRAKLFFRKRIVPCVCCGKLYTMNAIYDFPFDCPLCVSVDLGELVKGKVVCGEALLVAMLVTDYSKFTELFSFVSFTMHLWIGWWICLRVGSISFTFLFLGWIVGRCLTGSWGFVVTTETHSSTVASLEPLRRCGECRQCSIDLFWRHCAEWRDRRKKEISICHILMSFFKPLPANFAMGAEWLYR